MACSEHAAARAVERGIGAAAIEAAVRRGRSQRSKGAIVYTLDDYAIRRARSFGEDLTRFRWTRVVVSVEGVIVTVYRVAQALRRPRRRERQDPDEDGEESHGDGNLRRCGRNPWLSPAWMAASDGPSHSRGLGFDSPWLHSPGSQRRPPIARSAAFLVPGSGRPMTGS